MRTSFRFQRLCRFAVVSVTLACWLATPGCRQTAETTKSRLAAEATPTEVLQAMVDAYQTAEAYSDRGVLCLRYEQQGTRFHDEAPLAVVAAGQRLRVHAYQATIVCDGDELIAQIADPQEDEMGRQVLRVPAPPQLSLDSLLADPILQSAVTGGAGRLPVQLELLLGDAPLAAVLPETIEKRFLRGTRVEGHPCHGVEVTTDEGRFVFWIDRATFILRRLEYPVEVVPAGLGAEKPDLVAEFRHAQFASTGVDETFLVSVRPNQRSVAAFVVPPAPLASPLLGERIENFSFLNPAGSAVTDDSLAGHVAVLVWFSDHPACKSALQQLQRVADASHSSQVSIIAVCAESSARSHHDLAVLMQQWGVRVPMVRDLRAFGRDLFGIPGAPALVVLDAKGVVQVYQVGANPNLADELPVVLDRILQGDDLAAETRAQYEADVAAFHAAIQ